MSLIAGGAVEFFSRRVTLPLPGPPAGIPQPSNCVIFVLCMSTTVVLKCSLLTKGIMIHWMLHVSNEVCFLFFPEHRLAGKFRGGWWMLPVAPGVGSVEVEKYLPKAIHSP